MPDGGPYSLLTLSFVVFSFVSWQVRGRNPWQVRPRDPVVLGFCAAFLMLLVAVRLLVEQVAHLVGQAMSPESPDLFLATFDVLLIGSFLPLFTWTAVHVLKLATTADPIPK